MNEPATHRQVIDLWVSRAAMQRDIERAADDGSTAQVRLWYLRDSIPERWFVAVHIAAMSRGFKGVTYATLSTMAKANKTTPEAI